MYDIIIIGAGTAGIAAYKEAVKHTQNLLIINKGAWDTTCARVGCMPSKVLISAANRMHDIQTAEKVGLSITSKIDTSQIMQHVRMLREHFTNAISVHDKFHRILVLSGFFFLKIASTFLNSSFFPKPIKRRIAI